MKGIFGQHQNNDAEQNVINAGPAENPAFDAGTQGQAFTDTPFRDINTVSENETLPTEEIVATTKITSTMQIYGEVKSKDAIVSAGQIFGNITTSQSFSSNNLTLGNINAKKVNIANGRVKGDINVQDVAILEEGSIMVGNIYANDAVIYGKIKGDLDIQEGTTLLKNALVAGDILSTKITMEQGARINGNVTMRGKSDILDIESEFDLGGDF